MRLLLKVESRAVNVHVTELKIQYRQSLTSNTIVSMLLLSRMSSSMLGVCLSRVFGITDSLLLERSSRVSLGLMRCHDENVKMFRTLTITDRSPHLVKVCLNISGSLARPLEARERVTRLEARLWRLRLPPLSSSL